MRILKWNETTRATLLKHWNADDVPSASEIGRRMGFSKNSIIGEAHRMAERGLLKLRPNPRGLTKEERLSPPPAPNAPRATAPRPQHLGRHALPAGTIQVVGDGETAKVEPHHKIPVGDYERRASLSGAAAREAGKPTIPIVVRGSCCWPTWKERDSGYFKALGETGCAPVCGGQITKLGAVYCAEHERTALNIRERPSAENAQRTHGTAPPLSLTNFR